MKEEIDWKNFPPYIIAEACINNDGEIEIDKKMGYPTRYAGADCVKFQMNILEDEILRDTPKSDDFD